NTIKVGPLRSTRRACEPEIMQQEHKFLALLGSVATWQIDSDGVLVLIGEEGEIRAKKRTETPEN
ncbi:MAG: META domain-containing protein, partial [Chthoniobacterales bacterium]